MATFWIIPPLTLIAIDANGDPAPGAKAYVYEAGTATPLTVYTDSALTTPHSSPIVADAQGVFAPVYINGSQAIKLDITDSADNQLPGYPVDNITGIPFGGFTASNIAFTPTAGISAANVQDAIEELEADIAASADGLDYFPEVETAGTGNDYTLNAAGTVASYVDGTIFVLRLDRDNTGNATLNVDGLGAVAWKQHDGSGYVNFGAGELRDGDQHWVEYDSATAEFHSVFIRRRRATQAEAEAGTAVGPYMDPLRTKQAIQALSIQDVITPPQTTTSGDSFDFTGIPSGTSTIDIIFWQVSTTGTVEPLVQIGDSGGIETSGYVSDASDGGGTQSSTSGFIMGRNIAASSQLSGVMRLVRVDSADHKWVCAGDVSENGVVPSVGGSKELGAELDRVRITVLGGDTFDGGKVSLRYQ